MVKNKLQQPKPIDIIYFHSYTAFCGDSELFVTEEKTLKFNKVDSFKISNVTGSITITGWDKDYAEVRYLKKARSQSILNELIVIPSQKNSEVIIETKFAEKYSGCSVRYTVFLPKSLKSIWADIVTGAVTVDELDYVNILKCKSVVGAISATTAANQINLACETGAVYLDLKEIKKNGEINLSVTTGAIKLIAPDNFDATLDLETVIGRVIVDLPVTMNGTITNKRIKGTIGDGLVKCFARIVTGPIIIIKH